MRHHRTINAYESRGANQVRQPYGPAATKDVSLTDGRHRAVAALVPGHPIGRQLGEIDEHSSPRRLANSEELAEGARNDFDRHQVQHVAAQNRVEASGGERQSQRVAFHCPSPAAAPPQAAPSPPDHLPGEIHAAHSGYGPSHTGDFGEIGARPDANIEDAAPDASRQGRQCLPAGAVFPRPRDDVIEGLQKS